jgi:serine/threonine-protein kinase PknG
VSAPSLVAGEEGDARCARPNCEGIIDEGYCIACGHRMVGEPPRPAPPPAPALSTAGKGAGTGPPMSTPLESSRRATTVTTGSALRSRIGAGLVHVPPMPVLDPLQAVMVDPQVQEDRRFCSRCTAEVGRGRNGRPGRVTGYCGRCRHPFSFIPALAPGELVAAQYRVVGCLAYGGLGWIYLAQDERVSNRWVVLKGLLHADDTDAMTAAVAERQFLARVEHPNVVRIYNVVEHDGAGYIVMEYVGGRTLKTILKERQQANGGRPDPLPVQHAIAYILGILPAFAYLHQRGLAYNDLKPDNVMLQDDDVKLIDLGAVVRLDDPSAAIFGTAGFEAPEIAETGPTVESDLYTIARCLAVLSLDFRSYQTRYQHSLPDPDRHPILTEHESLHRFLLKGTAHSPDDRFHSAGEMADQLLGILHELVAAADGAPRPAVSSRFGADLRALRADLGVVDGGPDWRDLPSLKIDPADPAANLLVNAAALADAAQQVAYIEAALAQGQMTATTEVRLALARALIERGRLDDADEHLAAVEADGADWRVAWYRGLALLEAGEPARAQRAFDRVYSDLPGELAPKLALALAAELAGDAASAARQYDVVSGTDPSFTTAVFGLGRVRLAAGDRAGAVEALRRMPTTSNAITEARIAQARALAGRAGGVDPTAAELAGAGGIVAGLAAALDAQRRHELTVEVLTTVLDLVRAGSVAAGAADVLGCPLEEDAVRRELERAYRELARLSAGDEKIRLVDMANQVRPMTPV